MAMAAVHTASAAIPACHDPAQLHAAIVKLLPFLLGQLFHKGRQLRLCFKPPEGAVLAGTVHRNMFAVVIFYVKKSQGFYFFRFCRCRGRRYAFCLQHGVQLCQHPFVGVKAAAPGKDPFPFFRPVGDGLHSHKTGSRRRVVVFSFQRAHGATDLFPVPVHHQLIAALVVIKGNFAFPDPAGNKRRFRFLRRRRFFFRLAAPGQGKQAAAQ